MALNPQIPLMGRGIDLGGAVAAGLQSYQGAQRNKLLEQQTAAEAELQPLRNRLLTAQTGVAEQKLSKAEAEFQLGDAAQDAMMVKPLLASDPARAIQAMDARIEKIKARGGNPKDTIALRDGLASGQITPQQATAKLDNVIGTAERFGLLGQGGISAYQRENLDLQRQRLELQQSLTPAQAANIQIQNQRLAQQMPDFQGSVSGAKESAKLDVQGRMLPAIEGDKVRAAATAKAEVDRAGGVTKAISDEKEVGRILDLAEPLLEKATASLAGAGVDAAGRLVGVSNEGSKAAAQLKTLEGALIMKMPRMEGPQSNMDQQLYRQMAAQIGDATIPADQRKAAMDTLRFLNGRYTGDKALGGYQQGQIIEANGKRYRVTGGDPNDPDVEEVQ